MRITSGTKYNQMQYFQNNLQEKLNSTNRQIASGKKIQYGYQDASTNNQNLKLEYDTTNLAQGIDVANNAYTYTLNTDKALSDLSESMMEFNTKLVQAANQTQSSVSLGAIAMDLEKLRGHMLNIVNTSIGGKYIFGGSKVDARPFNDAGIYQGNDEKLRALVSSKSEIPFNITGKELFLSRDSDTNKMITTNIRKLNLSKLHPAIMSQSDQAAEPKEVYIKPSDTLRDLLGDNDNNPRNDGQEFFYLTGVRNNGKAFKAKFALDISYNNKDNATKVQDLLDRIGKAYGNSTINKVVDVTLNPWGQIQLRSLVPGSSNLDFHMVSSKHDVTSLNDFSKNGFKVTSYVKSNFIGDFENSSLKSVQDDFDHRDHSLPAAFISKDNVAAMLDTKLRDVLRDDVTRLEFNATRPNNKDGTPNLTPYPAPFIYDVKKNDRMEDLMQALNNYLGKDVEVSIVAGTLHFRDLHVNSSRDDMREPPFDGNSSFSISLKTKGHVDESFALKHPDVVDSEGYMEVKGLRNSYKVTYDHTYFTPAGSSLHGSVAQIDKNSKIATDDTKIADVANSSLEGKTFNLALKDHNGIDVEGRILLSERGSFLVLPNRGNTPSVKDLSIENPFDKSVLENRGAKLEPKEFFIPLFNPKDAPPAVSATKASNLTYRQLMDASLLALNYSNQSYDAYKALSAPPKAELDRMQAEAGSTKLGVTSELTQAKKDLYDDMVNAASANISFTLDVDGKMAVKDLIRSKTRMRFSMYDENSQEFTKQTLRNEKSSLRFNANNALTIDTPEINFFEQIDAMIKNVREGLYRPDTFDTTYTNTMRDIGIQNSLAAFAHLSNHVERMVAENGAQSRSFQNSIHRNEVLKVQVEGIKNDVIGTDIAETYNKFNTLTNNYNAALASTSKIAKMSLVDYL